MAVSTVTTRGIESLPVTFHYYWRWRVPIRGGSGHVSFHGKRFTGFGYGWTKREVRRRILGSLARQIETTTFASIKDIDDAIKAEITRYATRL